MKKFVSKCPVCEATLEIVELRCPSCGTLIRGNFPINKFLQLDDDDREFVIEFLRSRGNIKEVQGRLGISYPTAKARLERLLKNLNLYEEEKKGMSKEEILEKLENGEITAEEAIDLLKASKDE